MRNPSSSPGPRAQHTYKNGKGSLLAIVASALINMLGLVIGASIIARQTKKYSRHKHSTSELRSDESSNMYVVSERGPTIKDLLQEASILVSSIDANVTRLWQIRNIEVTIWIFTLSIGLGQFSGGKISLALLGVSFGIPLVFIMIDRRLNKWYLIMRKRSEQISSYINKPEPLRHIDKLKQNFPLYNPAMKFTDDESGRARGIDWNVLCFYGGQLAVSVTVFLYVFYGVVTGKYEEPAKPNWWSAGAVAILDRRHEGAARAGSQLAGHC